MNGRLVVWGALGGVLALTVAAGSAALFQGSRAAAVPALSNPGDYGTLPDFSLTERSGRTVRKADLAGRYWIADFIFTRCTGVCPLLTARMSSLAAAVSRVPGGDQVRLISITVDPAWDTPEVLSRYAAGPAAGVRGDRWLFLTGAPEEIYRLVKDGFRLSVAERPPGPGDAGDLITHSDRLVLVDPAGRITGYYHGTDDAAVDKLVMDLTRLLSQGPV